MKLKTFSFTKRTAILLFVFSMVATTGCYQRTIAPELTYDPAQVEKLEAEIDKLDWE